MITEEEREHARTVMFQLISELERISKKEPGTAEKIMATVRQWEQKLFAKSGQNRTEYLGKVQQKRDQCQQEIDKHRAQKGIAGSQPAAVSAVQPPVTSAAPPSQQARVPVPSVDQHSITRPPPSHQPTRPTPHSSIPVATQVSTTLNVATLPQSVPRTSAPPQQVANSANSTATTSTTTTSMAPVHVQGSIHHQPSPGTNVRPSLTSANNVTTTPGSSSGGPSKRLDELREPLEHCRGILRIINVFGFKKREAQLKEDFMTIFAKTTETIKAHKSGKLTASEVDTKVETIHHQLRELRQKIDARFKPIKDMLQMDRTEEILELDTKPFGLLERIIDVKGNEAQQNRMRAVSFLIGSEYSLKRYKSSA